MSYAKRAEKRADQKSQAYKELLEKRNRCRAKNARRSKRNPLVVKGLGHTVVPTGVALDMQNQPVREPPLPPSTSRDATLNALKVVPIRIVYLINDDSYPSGYREEPAVPRATPKPQHKKDTF